MIGGMAVFANRQHTNFSVDTPRISDRIYINSCARFTGHYHFGRVKSNLPSYAADTFKLTGSTYKFISSHSLTLLAYFSLNCQPLHMRILNQQLPLLISYANGDFSCDQIYVNTIYLFEKLLIDRE